MGKLSNVGGLGSKLTGLVMSGAGGHAAETAALPGASNLVITSLQGPSFTTFGFAWRRSRAVESNLSASRKLAGGFAFTSALNSAATSSTVSALRLMAMRLEEPMVFIASGNGPVAP